MRDSMGALLLATALCACTGASTGDPPDDSDFPVPAGAQLVRSALARETSPATDAERDEQLARGNRQFAWDMYRELADADENLFFSPYSISIAMAMTQAGAQGNTATEIAGALHYTLPQPELHEAINATSLALNERENQLMESPDGAPTEGDGFQLNIVNQAWGQQNYTFLDGYLDVLAQHYGSGLLLVDFGQAEATRTLINGWVADQTEQRVRDLIPSGVLDDGVRLVLTNAIYFKASWLEKFDPKDTAPATFAAPAGAREVSMMALLNTKIRYGAGANYQAVSLRYLAPDVSMLLVLPAEGQFDAVAQGFDADFFDEVRASITGEATTVKLPKWKFESEQKLKAPMQALGVQDAFLDGVADFSGMDGRPRELFIDEIFHKAFVAVDEKGTEAAAATAVVVRDESASEPREIEFDRPFIFAIFDEPTGEILFIGHLVDPS